VAKLPKEQTKAFENGEICFGDVLKEQALLRELLRNIQIMRKKKKLLVTEKISLFLGTDRKTEALMKKNGKKIMSGVGASKIEFSVPKGKEVKGELEFDKKKIKVYFEKVKK